MSQNASSGIYLQNLKSLSAYPLSFYCTIPPHPSPTALSHVRGGIFVLRAKITKIFGLRMKDREINRSKHYGAYTLLAGLLIEDEKRLHIHLYSGIYLPRSPAAGQPDTSHYSRTLYRQGSKRQKITMENMCQLTGSLCYLGVSLYKSGKGVPPVTSDTPISHLFFIIKALSCSCLS